MLINWDWGDFFPKIGKLLTPVIKDKKLTYSNSSLELWKKRKYATLSLPVKKNIRKVLYLL